jgi:hypothetical protein
MHALLSFLAWAVLVGLACWLFGGVALRVGGAMLAAVGLLSTAMTGSLSAALLAAIGTVAWLAGHWLLSRAPPLLPLAAGPPCLSRGAAPLARSHAAVGHPHGPARAAVEQPTTPARGLRLALPLVLAGFTQQRQHTALDSQIEAHG